MPAPWEVRLIPSAEMRPPAATFAGPEIFRTKLPTRDPPSKVEFVVILSVFNDNDPEGTSLAPPVTVKFDMLLMSIVVLVPINPPLSAIKLVTG